ncbi:MAG TPA: hypothetical protein VGX00_09000 [Thermoplasmata archaeon]|nr:hypothetical protein [Thermoplasmata archaeon]
MAIFAVLVVVLTGMLTGGGLSPTAQSGRGSNAHLSPFATPVTSIYVNRSQSSGTYVGEFVTLNNSSTLTRIPSGLITVKSATDCRWVTVVNVTSSSVPVSIFHNVKYTNVTAANASGTKVAGLNTVSFKACGGNAYWVNFVYWTYSVYNFASTGLGVNVTITAQNFSAWPGTTTVPGAVSAKVGPKAVAQFIIATNLTTFSIVFPSTANGSTSCDATGQICSYTQWKFVTASDTTNSTKADPIVFSAASQFRVTAAYENWTLSFSNGSVSVNTAIGGFFSMTGTAFQQFVVNFWFVWIVVLLGVVASVLYLTDGMKRRR